MAASSNKILDCLITPGRLTNIDPDGEAGELLDVIAAAVNAGLAFVQIREKELSGRDLFELTSRAVAAAKGSMTRILVNGRPDIALAAGAAGVHLPANGLPVSAVRAGFSRGFIVGASTHSIDEARNAARSGADLILFSPVFAAPGKGGPVGLKLLTEVCEIAAPVPVLALGGINAENYQSVLDAGAAGAAAIRFFNDRNVLEGRMLRG